MLSLLQAGLIEETLDDTLAVVEGDEIEDEADEELEKVCLVSFAKAWVSQADALARPSFVHRSFTRSQRDNSVLWQPSPHTVWPRYDVCDDGTVAQMLWAKLALRRSRVLTCLWPCCCCRCVGDVAGRARPRRRRWGRVGAGGGGCWRQWCVGP